MFPSSNFKNLLLVHTSDQVTKIVSTYPTPMFKIQSQQTLAEAKCKLYSPISLSNQVIYCVSENGDVLKVTQDKSEVLFTILGFPTALQFKGLTGGFLIADFAHQSIFHREDNQVEQITNLITEYNQKAFQGPSSIVVNQYYSHMYFTDSGPFGETSIENKTGSIFLYMFDDKSLRAISYRNLAYPWGLVLDQDERFLLVCEFGQNRILKFLLDEECSGNYSVFHQFNGRAGPSVICSHNDLFFCVLYEYNELCSNGLVAVLTQQGDILQKIKLPCNPEITGINFMPFPLESPKNNESLLVTEGNKLHIIKFKGDKNEMGDQSEGILQISGRNQ